MADKTDKNAGDAPPAKSEKGRSKVKMQTVVEEEPQKTPSELILEERLRKAEERKNRFKNRWPVISKPPLNTRPWRPLGPPRRLAPIKLELPALTLRRWVPPYRRRRRRRPRMPRIPPEEINKEMYECAKLKKIWHHFAQVDKNKMMLQGTLACNSKRYRCGVGGGAQTACIAFVCRGLLNDKAPSELTRQDVDDVIDAGDKFYHQCRLALKCYKGKPQLELKQLLTTFYLKDYKYTIKIQEKERGILAKHPDFAQQAPSDLMALMEKRAGTTYMSIMTVGDRNFLIWGHPPPPEAASQCRTVCYIFDPHMQSETGMPHKLHGGAAFLRYAGVTSFVLDFVANYGGLDASKRECPMPEVILTDIEVLARDPLLREPRYELDLKTLPAHCEAEWMSLNNNALIERKHGGEFPLQSLSAVSLATSRTTSRRKLREFYQKVPKEPAPTLPMAPEKGPAGPTLEHIMASRGEDFFLYCPTADAHTYGRDDMIPRAKSETMLHSMVDVANKQFRSQFRQIGAEKWILRATRHMASHRYQKFKVYTAIPCCLIALGMLRKLRARGWNDDIMDETLDLGYNLYRESMVPREGLIRRLVLGEMAESFKIRETEFTHKDQGISVWGKLVSNNPKVFDLCRGIDEFFKFADTGILQIPGEYETAIWNEGGLYYLYHPWPADRMGRRVGLREGGKACLLCFTTVTGLCEDFLASTRQLRRKPYSISAVNVIERPTMPPALNSMKPVGPNRWVLRGTFHEGDTCFAEEHRNKQATPTSIIAIAASHLEPLDEWTSYRVDDTLRGGDQLYETTMEHLERMGISLEQGPTEEEVEGEAEEIPKGTLAAADVFNKHRSYDPDAFVETEVQDSAFVGAAPALLLAAALLAMAAGAGADWVTVEQCRGRHSDRVRHYPGDSSATELYMSHCGLTEVKSTDIANLQEVHYIYLHSNSITHIDTSALRTVPALTVLYLNSNQFREPPVFAAGSCDRLTGLYLHYNLLTALTDEGTFSACSLLKTLSLFNNQIEHLHRDIFKSLVELELLSLSHNKIKFIPNNMLTRNSKLKILYLHNNGLTHLPPEFASSLKRAGVGLETFYFRENPWHCACLVELMVDVKRAGVKYINYCYYVGAPPVCVYSGAETCRHRGTMLTGAGAGGAR